MVVSRSCGADAVADGSVHYRTQSIVCDMDSEEDGTLKNEIDHEFK